MLVPERFGVSVESACDVAATPVSAAFNLAVVCEMSVVLCGW